MISENSTDRVSDESYQVWEREEIIYFLEKRLGLSKDKKIKGRIVTHHNEALFYWKELIEDYKLLTPFEGKFFRFDKEKLDSCGWDRDMVITYYNSLAKSFKYTCLSDTDESNMPMWAYYANNYQGFCVEYLLCEMQKKYIFPVTYEPERVSANAITTNLLYEYMKMREEGKDYTDTSADANVYLQMMILSLAAKHKSWEHEKEYRIICHRDDFPAIPSKIYIGLNCKEEYRKLLTEVGKSIEVCKVYEMEIDDISSRFGFKQKLIT